MFTLAAINADPFIVIAPTNRKCEPGSLELLSTRKCLFLTLSDVLSIDESGMPVAGEQCAKLLSEFHLAIIPALQPDSREASPIAFFPTPANATWSDVQILFRDGHTVVVSVGDKSGVYNFAQMGMSKRNTGTPTAQWELLEAFADRPRRSSTGSSERASRSRRSRSSSWPNPSASSSASTATPSDISRKSKGWEANFDIGFCQ